jgi:hypothetical protein
LPIKYIVESHEDRVDPNNSTKIIRSEKSISSEFKSEEEAVKFIGRWCRMFNVAQGRNIEFRIFNNRVNPEKFSDNKNNNGE